MNLLETDSRFLAQASEVARSEEHRFNPGDIEQINGLHRQGLGLPFYTKFDASSKPFSEQILIGIALPLKGDQTQHLVMLISGKKLIIEPIDEGNRSKYVHIYSGASSVELQEAVDLDQIGRNAFDNKRFMGCKIIDSNDTPDGKQRIDQAIPGAIGWANYIKDLSAPRVSG